MIMTNTELAKMMAKEGFGFDHVLRVLDAERTPEQEKLPVTDQYVENLRLNLLCRISEEFWDSYLKEFGCIGNKNYRQYNKVVIGESDIAALVLVGYEKEKGLSLKELTFTYDGLYSAYLVDENAEIGNHYTKVAAFDSWLKIYDDKGLALKVSAKKINVFRAGEQGCIIQLIQKNRTH